MLRQLWHRALIDLRANLRNERELVIFDLSPSAVRGEHRRGDLEPIDGMPEEELRARYGSVLVQWV